MKAEVEKREVKVTPAKTTITIAKSELVDLLTEHAKTLDINLPEDCSVELFGLRARKNRSTGTYENEYLNLVFTENIEKE